MPDHLYADIIIPVALEKSYTYLIGDNLRRSVKRGSRVIVEFGRGRLYTGVVEKTHNEKPDHRVIKQIIDTTEHLPVINEIQLDLWQWISDYYMCKMGEVLDAALPSGLKAVKDRSGSYSTRNEQFISLSKSYTEKELNNIFDGIIRSSARTRLLLKYLEITGYPGKGSVPEAVGISLLIREASVSPGVMTALIKANVLRQVQVESARLPDREVDRISPFELSPVQEEVREKLSSQLDEKGLALLQGVTSSGKTEIYIHLIEEQIRSGKQVLYLLPEIALTAQIINRLRRHFGNWVGVYHSKFNDSERVEVWRRVAGEFRGREYKIILGVRSSIFLPFVNLGLIIVDEEHDSSYKQIDPAPRYNARDASTMLARLHNAKVLFGSATPSLETRYNAETGKYGLVELSERFGKVHMPGIILADTSEAYRRKIMVSHFTPQLLNAIDEALSSNEQVVLLRNRRGFAPFIQCRECGWIPQCNSCSVSMTYHKNINRLICHYCGSSSGMLAKCGNCSSTDLVMKGYGTEKLEDELKALYPEAKIIRMDMDTTRRKGAFDRIISDLEKGKTDILIGTQMISKGLDFEGLTVVGIVNVDNMLHFPDFRSHEKCFQLIEQVSGRAGRRSKKGKVIVQTADPNHPVMNQVMFHDYMRMYLAQRDERREFGYPPFTRLIRIFVKHKDRRVVKETSQALAGLLRKSLGKRVLGPEFPLISRIQSYYIMTILLKIEKDKPMIKVKELIDMALKKTRDRHKSQSLRIYADVDPL